MKRRITIELVTLNTRAHIPLPTNITHQLPTSPVYILNANYWLQEHCIGKVNFWDPNSAKHMRPQTSISLLKGTVGVRAQYALDRRRGRLDAAATQPLALGYVGHAIALLVNG